jgi:hypothetical protein
MSRDLNRFPRLGLRRLRDAGALWRAPPVLDGSAPGSLFGRGVNPRDWAADAHRKGGTL